MGKVTLTRPDGSQFEADYKDVDQYKALGYEPESAQAGYSRNIEQAKEDYFTSPEQRFGAGAEGVLNGLTVGGSTALLGDEDEAERARYNPGTRLGGEIVGSILPSLLPGGAEVEGARIAEMGGDLLAHTPQGLLTRGAEAIAEGTTATKTGHALVKGAVEGAGMGAGAAITNAKLSGDPVTAEAVVAGVGWGALWGGGLGYAAGKLEVTAAARAARLAEEAKPATKGAMVEAEKYGAFRSAVEDVRKTTSKTLDDAVDRIATNTGKLEDSETLASTVLEHAGELEKTQDALFNRIDVDGGWVRKGANGLKSEILATRKSIAKAIKNRNYKVYEELADRQVTQMKALGDIAKVAAPEIQPFLVKSAVEGKKAVESLGSLSAVTETLNDFPFTAEGFRGMKPSRMEKVSAAVDSFLKDAPDELTPQKNALSGAIDTMAADAGLQLDQYGPGQKLRAIHEALRSSKTVGAAEEAAKLKAHGFGTGTMKYVGAHEASNLAKQAGAGIIGRGLAREGAHRLISGLLNLAGGVKGMLIENVAKFALNPQTAKVAKFVGPRLDPLKVRLDGSLEQNDLPRKTLMQMRMKEIREAAPTINDTMYRAVEPIAGAHPELAAGMSNAAVAMFNALVLRMPRDPGTAFNRMQSLWTADPIMTEKFARAYEVFHNPVGVAIRFLQNPKSITPEGAKAMQEFSPELWTTLRVEMLNRLPDLLPKMNYSQQVALGQLLDIRIHSTQDPKFIESQQMMFQQRDQPLPAKPSQANNSNNPSGVSRSMTAAQRITEH